MRIRGKTHREIRKEAKVNEDIYTFANIGQKSGPLAFSGGTNENTR